MKLVVTGHDEKGSAVFTYAGDPPHRLEAGGGTELLELWSTRGKIVVPDATDPKEPFGGNFFPPLGETRFKLMILSPGELVPAGSGEANIGPADMRDVLESDDPGMHTTDTIDYLMILSGEVDLELDDGRMERLGAGDCVVQRGTRHAWRVRGEEPLVAAAVLIGAQRNA
jgi:mannose-6-phosphate isomerase-like protein (cupin superfamily)